MAVLDGCCPPVDFLTLPEPDELAAVRNKTSVDMDVEKKRSLLPEIHYEDVEKVTGTSGTNSDELLETAATLVEWMHTQRHLPIPRENLYKYLGFICRVLFRKKLSMELTKKFVDSYYTIRRLVPEYLMNRDPADPQLRASLDHFNFAPMPVHTDQMTTVYVGQILDKTLSPHMMVDWLKYSMMVAEVQQWEDASLGEEIVIDVGKLTLQHVSIATPSFIKKIVVCYLKAIVFTPRSIHFLNVPSYAEKLFTLLKCIIKPKVANRVFVHSTHGYETLHQHISPKYLPSDFGGEGPALEDLHGAWLRKLDSYRDWFLEQDNYVVQEKLRPGKPVSHSDVFGIEGSFRQLVVD